MRRARDCCGPRTCRRSRSRALGNSSSARIGTLVKDVVTETLAGGMTEIRMSEPVLDAVLGLRSFLFEAVYENSIATAEFKKAADILSGLWEKVRERPTSSWTVEQSSRKESMPAATSSRA